MGHCRYVSFTSVETLELTRPGALGIPRIPLLEDIGLQRPMIENYQFFDTTLEDRMENAFQALALDEKRSAYEPTVWDKPAGNKTVSPSIAVSV